MEDYRLSQTGQEVQDILNGAAMQVDLNTEVERATDAEGTLQENIDAEAQARQDADGLLQQGIDDEAQRAKDAEEANAGEIEGIKALIPSTASDANKLADTNYVNSSIQTATAEYRGDYNVVTDLHLAVDATHAQIETLLPTVIAEADKNDYCYVMIPTSAQTPTEIAKIERYKMTSEGWKFEYDVNNSTFTAEEWAAIKSGVTSGLVAKLNALPTNADLLLLLAGKQDVLTFDSVPVPESNNPVKSGGVYSAIDDEKTARLNSDTAIHTELDGLQAKVPATASSDNKLVDQNQMNSSISTATATFRGDWNVVSDLHLAVDATRAQIAALLPTVISTADNNDYCYVEIPTSAETPTQIERVERYKFNGTAWAYEYTLNNSGFTADQWAAINSMITSGLVAKLSALPTNADLLAMLAQKQDNLTFDSTPTENSTNPVTSGGVFAADKALSDAIEAILLLIPSAASSLNKLVDTALLNSSISTATATFRGTYNLVSDLGLGIDATEGQIAAALLSAISTADNNDYAFVQIPTSAQTPTQIARTDRYKFNGTAWAFEYTLNTSGFTAAQWAAINSTITSALVAKLNALPTAAELQEALGTLTSGITAINQKIPSTASQSNKLVDNASMESYITQVINILDASFNVTSTDGHITLHITQVDGVITSVQVQSTDIASAADLALKASQADLTALASRVTTAEGNISSLTGRMGTAETNIANLQQLYNNLQQSKPVPVIALPSTGQQQGVIYRLAGTTSYSDYMWNGSSWVLMATYNNAIDPRPKKASQNLVTSGGVFDNMGALDVSELNATENPHTLAQYADLSSALAAIPTDYQKGGMSIKFVQSSDNKYVQFRLMKNQWSDTPSDWQGVDKEPINGSHNLVESGFVVKKKVGTNRFDGNYDDGCYIDRTNGNIVTNGSIANVLGVTSKIYFNGAPKITVTCGSGWSSIAGYAIYNDSDEVISYGAGSNGTYTITNVSGGVYLRYTINLTINDIKRLAVPGEYLSFFDYSEITGYFNGISMEEESAPKSIEISKALSQRVKNSEGINLYSGELENVALKYNSGEPISNVTGVKTTYPIYFGEHSSICCNCTATAISGYGFAVYNSDNEVVGYGVASAGNFTVVNKSSYTNASYVRFSVVAELTVNKQIQYGTDITEYYDYCPIEGYLNTYLPKSNYITSKLPIKASKNLFNGIFEDGAGIYSSNGSKETNVGWKGLYFLSDKIYFNGNSNIVCNHCMSVASGFGYAIYNNLDEKVGYGSYSQAGTAVISNVEGGAYVRLTLSSTRLLHDPIMIAYGSTLPHYEPYSLLSGYKKVNILYANSVSGVDDDSHFYGNDAIRKAIYSINDESANNEYIIKATGNFIATLPSHYKLYGTSYAMFWLRRYISLEGVGECVISGTLPDSLTDCQADKPSFVKADYEKYQPIFVMEGCKISNVTLIARNTRYPLHIDGSINEAAKDVDYIVKNCKCIHQGKHGDAVGTTGGTASGFGLSSGSYYLFDNCYFEAPTSGLYVHTNVGYSKKPTIEWRNCKVVNKASHTASSISFFTLNNPVGSVIKVTDCVFNKNLKVDYSVDSSSPVCERVDTYSSEDAIIEHSPVATFVPSNNGIGLRVTGGNSVRFDKDSSAFDAIIGYSDESAFVDFNKYALAQQYGYCWRDGDVNIDAMAVGLRNISTSGDYTLGARLGDCSGTSKVLKVTVDSVEYTITFDSDYTSATNADILAIVNTALNGAATADLYALASQFYPQYNDMGVEVVDDATPVLTGMGLTFTQNGVKKASSTDNVDAIALSSGVNGGMVRVMYKGEIAYKNAPITIKFGTEVNVSNIGLGTKLGISETEDGCFVVVASSPSVIVRTHGAELI